MIINKWAAGRYLQGFSTAMLNSLQVHQKFIDLGADKVRDVWDYYNAHKEDADLKRLIENYL